MLYAMDANYKTLTDAESAELVPLVDLPANSLTPGMVLRGQLAGKISKAEGPATIQLRVAICPPNWIPSHAYAIGDLVTNDGLQKYRCTAAGTSDSSGGPTGSGASITDGTVTWEHKAESRPVLDTYDVPLDEAEHTDAFWSLTFALHIRQSRDFGSSFHDWHGSAVATGELVGPILPARLILPTIWPSAAIVETGEANVLHVIYTPELETMSITAMVYTLEAL